MSYKFVKYCSHPSISKSSPHRNWAMARSPCLLKSSLRNYSRRSLVRETEWMRPMGWKAFLRLQVRAELGPLPSVFTLILDVSARILYCEPPKLTWTILRERRFHCKCVQTAGGRGSASENRQEPKETWPPGLQSCCHRLLRTCCLGTAAPATLPRCHSELQLPPPQHQVIEAVQREEEDTRETSRTRRAKQMWPFLLGIWARGVDADRIPGRVLNTELNFLHRVLFWKEPSAFVFQMHFEPACQTTLSTSQHMAPMGIEVKLH